MNRREVLQRTAAVLGYAVTGPALAGIMQGCKASPELPYKPDFFSEDQALLISELSEIIIPATDTPGAKAVGVPAFIDSFVKEVYPPEARENFLKGIAAFDEDAKSTYGSAFAECEPEEKVAHVKKHHDAALAQLKDAGERQWWRSGTENAKPFIMDAKELILIGYFSSEDGATKAIQYNQTPGPYKGCVPLQEAGKTWAT